MTTAKERKSYSADFKAKVALEAVRGRLTINQIAREFSVHPNQISKWKKQFLQSLPQIFDNSKKPNPANNEELINGLYQQIGQMKVELDWLKKNLPFSAGVRRELVEPENERISIKRQCELLGLNRIPALLPGATGKRRRCDFDAPSGRAIYGDTVLRLPADDRVFTAVRVSGQS